MTRSVLCGMGPGTGRRRVLWTERISTPTGLVRAIEIGARALFASDVAATRAAPAYIVVAGS